jgi:2-polyprenyl-3-methyl-5-hydroxy-6-metoxy-1,4-benzoquinol methylase
VTVSYINPNNQLPLVQHSDVFRDSSGATYPIVRGIPRFCEADNYSTSFGRQWNRFQTTQIDCDGAIDAPSARRLFAEANWTPTELAGTNILEVGSGAGRFSRVLLEHTDARLYSVDYSTAVEVNLKNNAAWNNARLFLSQASIYELPFTDGSFDKVICLGVLQHTPDFEASVRALVSKAKVGGEIVVDFYEIRGFWTKLHAKYLLRPITRRMSHEQLLGLIERNAGRLISASRILQRTGLGLLRRFLPVVDMYGALPTSLPEEDLREWVVLDTFDMFSPAYDNPQRLKEVARMFERAGATVTFSGHVDYGIGSAAVVRAVRR